MVWIIASEIIEAMNDDIDLFIKLTEGKLTDRQDAFCCYIFGIMTRKEGVTKLYKMLRSKGISEKIVKDFLKYSLKMKYKMDKGLWSWNEINEFDIPFDQIKQTSTKYQLPDN